MAPPSSRPKPSPLNVQITFPRILQHAYAGKKVTFQLTPEDFELSWLDFIKKHAVEMYQILVKQDRFTIMDIRTTSTRKVWKLNSTVKLFINGFGRTLQSYKAVIGTQPSNTNRPPVAQASSSSLPNGSGSNSNRSPMKNSANARPSNSSSMKKDTRPVQDLRRNKPPYTPVPTSTRSSSRNKPGDFAKAGPSPFIPLKGKMNGNGMAPPVEPPVPKCPRIDDGELSLKISTGAGLSNGTPKRVIPTHFNFPLVDVDDSASMAPTVDSQDSQDDLREAGVKIEEVKNDIVKRLTKQFDNNMMLRMKHELQGLMKTEKYFSALKKLPFTANMLQYIFRLNEHN